MELSQDLHSEREPFNASFSTIQSQDTVNLDLKFKEIKSIWNLYLSCIPPEKLSMSNTLHKLIRFFCQVSQLPFFKSLFQVGKPKRGGLEVTIHYPELMKKLQSANHQYAELMLQIFQEFQFNAQSIISALTLVLHHYLHPENSRVLLRLEETPQIQICQLRAALIETYVSFKAIVRKVTIPKIEVVCMGFQCFQCKLVFKVYFYEGNYIPPTTCQNPTKPCKSKTFVQQKENLKTIFFQRIKVEELDTEARVPRQVTCEIRDNFIGSVISGDLVTIGGMYKIDPQNAKDRKHNGLFSEYVLVNSLIPKRPSKYLTEELLLKMKSYPRIFYSLIKSFCPTIYGHEMVKAGMLLAMVGGSRQCLKKDDTFRQTCHILLLGDPGIGKSQLLRFAADIMPHSSYFSSACVSTAGLTAAINRGPQGTTIQIGAVIQADGGICAIDQFDKLGDVNALLEIMEQQTVTITKSGVMIQMASNVGILASANPTYGSYRKDKSFRQNCKINSAILSRFDLIFLMIDTPDPERDKKLYEHVIKIHQLKHRKVDPNQFSEPTIINTSKQYEPLNDYLSYRDKLVKEIEREQNEFNHEELGYYLNHVKTKVHPTLSRRAAEVLKGFFLALRQNYPSSIMSISNRQLEALVRLSMARARIECRTLVTEEDALEVTSLVQESLFDVFDELGYNINSLKQQTKKAQLKKPPGQLSLPKQRTIFIDRLNELTSERENNVWEWNQMVKVAKELGLTIGDFHNFIERLNQEGVLLQKGSKKYALQGTFF